MATTKTKKSNNLPKPGSKMSLVDDLADETFESGVCAAAEPLPDAPALAEEVRFARESGREGEVSVGGIRLRAQRAASARARSRARALRLTARAHAPARPSFAGALRHKRADLYSGGAARRL